MAMLINTAVVTTLAKVIGRLMGIQRLESAESRAEREIAKLFVAAGWRVEGGPVSGHRHADLSMIKNDHKYVAEIKAASEGRSDRAIALLSQAILQARAYAREIPKAHPLAVLWVRVASPALLRKVDDFHRQFAPDIAIGIVSGDGFRHFIGRDLEALNAAPSRVRRNPLSRPRHTYNLFSDLNQWMLKVLLAPELPERLLAAPRAEYRNISELASAADVSVMSASRFVARMKKEGFIDESGPNLRLVQREQLFQRWQSAQSRSSPEARMRFLIPGARQEQLRALLSRDETCLGLFAAADLLGMGHVAGVPPFVYVRRISQPEQQAWKELVPPAPGEPPHLVIKQALAPQSLFRGAIMQDGMHIADVLQVWLDVSSHPARGAEQAELIYRKILQGIIRSDA